MLYASCSGTSLEETAMVITELPTEESIALVARLRKGHLAFAEGSQPLLVPIYYAYHEDYLYCFTTLGQKVEVMRANPLVAFEVEEFSADREWTTVVMTGRYEELAPHGAAGETAWELLQKCPMWWEPGYAKTIRRDGTERSLEPIYFRIFIDSIRGHHAHAS
jgi:nitroimidazol reductase NimA-like FMN-containing flavoprotein (pyridoxamine 5'-phosphate oxidase superfamily)